MKRGAAISAVLIVSCTCLAAPRAHAQGTCTAQGRVVDGLGNPVPDVQVLLDYKGHVVQKYRTKTDKNGNFIHLNVYTGPYRIILKKEGVGEASFDFDIHEMGSTQKAPEFKLVSPGRAAPSGSGLAPAGAPSAGVSPADAGRLVADLNAARALSEQGKVDEAIAAYEAIAARATQISLVHYGLANASKRKGDLARAEAEYRRSIELDPGFVDGYVGLATLLAEGGKRDHAIEVVKQGAAANEKSSGLQYALGVLEVGAGDNAAAKAAFLKAEALDPQNAETQYHLATVALNMNNRAEAVTRLERFLAAAPDNPNAAVAKALLAALQKK